MTIITKIEVQKLNNERFNIYTDSGNGEEFAFSVDADTIVKFNLKKGMTLELFEIEEILHADQLRKAYLSSIVYLSRMMRTKKEIEQYLLKHEFLDQIIRMTLLRLEEEGYINEERYADSYVRTIINTTLKGPGVIQNDLITKGISREIIEKSLEKYSEELQLDHAVQLCEKKVSSLNRYSSVQKKVKLEEMLQRKGYHSPIISLAINNVNYESEEDEEIQNLLKHARKVQKKYDQLSEWEYSQKMKAALFRKGFSLEMIEKALQLLNEENELYY